MSFCYTELQYCRLLCCAELQYCRLFCCAELQYCRLFCCTELQYCVVLLCRVAVLCCSVVQSCSSEESIGLPIAVQCVTLPYREELCLRLMAELEAAVNYKAL